MDVIADDKSLVLLPSEDPFYSAPINLAGVAPGTVLRVRAVELALLGVIPQQFEAWQLLYRTTDLDGIAEVAVTTVLLPSSAERVESRPLLAFQCAIDAISQRCFPSYALRRGARALGALPSYEFLLVANALERGWAVSIADHGGLSGRFGAPREPGYRVLDGARAAKSFLTLDAEAPVALWGYSGGGMASSWAAEMAPGYAPELPIVGAVLGSPVGDLGETFRNLNGTLHAGLSAMVVSVLRHTHPGLGRVIRTHFDFDAIRVFDAIERYQTITAVLRFAGDDLDRYTDIPLSDVLALPDVAAVLDDIRLGNRAPECPVLVVQAVRDQIIGVDAVDGQVERYLDAGVHVTYVRDRWSEHMSLAVLSVPAALAWLADRIEGRELPTAQTSTVRSMVLTRSGVRGLLGMGIVALKVLAGRPINGKRLPAVPVEVVETEVTAKAS